MTAFFPDEINPCVLIVGAGGQLVKGVESALQSQINRLRVDLVMPSDIDINPLKRAFEAVAISAMDYSDAISAMDFTPVENPRQPQITYGPQKKRGIGKYQIWGRNGKR